MYCPKCGNEAAESQRFCKRCGTNLQMIYDALGSSDTNKGPFGIDMEALGRNAAKFAESWRTGWNDTPAGNDWSSTSRDTRRTSPNQPAQPPLPKPKEWLHYSWQHNLKEGLLALFGGVGLGIFLYYMSRLAIQHGTIWSIEQKFQLQGLQSLVAYIWLIAAIPVTKGIGQIIYAAFFAESIATLTDRFIPRPQAPSLQEPPSAYTINGFAQPPLSVTEHTTQFIQDEPIRAAREAESK